MRFGCAPDHDQLIELIVGLDEASGRFLYSLPNCRFATHRPDIYSGPVFGGEVWT